MITTTYNLTPRELEVLSLAANGDASKAIAKSLLVSKRTIDFHFSNIYLKLEVANRIQAINKAKDFGLLGIKN